MLINLLRVALERRDLLQFNYDDKSRTVEPHALGLNKKGELVMRAFQVGGQSATSDTGWKLFTLEKATDLVVVMDGESRAPRPGYKKGDKAMVTILAELDEPELEAVAA
jgi:hypothetical protein